MGKVKLIIKLFILGFLWLLIIHGAMVAYQSGLIFGNPIIRLLGWLGIFGVLGAIVTMKQLRIIQKRWMGQPITQ